MVAHSSDFTNRQENSMFKASLKYIKICRETLERSRREEGGRREEGKAEGTMELGSPRMNNGPGQRLGNSLHT